MFSLLFWLLSTGRLYTRSQHQEIVEPLRERIEDQRVQLEKAIETNDRLTTAVQNLVVPAHTASTALREIAKEAKRPVEGGGE
jgi:methyl-accepting chemotaxis protein